jgi:signal peptidase I
LTQRLKRLWKNEYVQTGTIIGLIILIFFGLWYGSTLILNNPNPIVVVPSGSMCIPYDGACNGWDHPFARTLHVGDLLILQGLDPKDYNTNYPSSDIIVFHNPSNPDELIVHRIVSAQEINGVIYFRTKGDGNSFDKWPATPQPTEYDPWAIPGVSQGVSQDLVVGKVILRIPWLGHIVLFMRTSAGLAFVVFLVALLLVVEFIVPVLRKKKERGAAERLKK